MQSVDYDTTRRGPLGAGPLLRAMRTDPLAYPLKYATAGAACFDLTSLGCWAIQPGDAHTFSTGWAFEVPVGFVLMLHSRSGHGFKEGLRLCNSTGVIDSDYRGEVCVRLHNDSFLKRTVRTGDRIAQAMLVALPSVKILEVTSLSETARGANGFGSTGK